MNDEELLYDQLVRKVDNQIKRKERLESQATAFLRTIFTIVGLFVSVAVAFPSALTLPSFDTIKIALNADTMVGQLNNVSYLDIAAANFITNSLIALVVFAFLAAVFYIFAYSSYNAYKVLSPTVLEPSPNGPVIGNLAGTDRSNFDKIFDEYTKVIRRNEIKLDESSDFWESAYNAIPAGVSIVFIGLSYAIYISIVQEAMITIAMFGLVVISGIGEIYNRFGDDLRERIWITDTSFDIPLVAVIVYMVLMVTTSWAGSMPVVMFGGGLTIIALGVSLFSLRLESAQLWTLTMRNAAFLAGVFTLWIVLVIGTERPDQVVNQTYPLASVVSGLLFAAVYSGALFLVKKAYELFHEYYMNQREEKQTDPA